MKQAHFSHEVFSDNDPTHIPVDLQIGRTGLYAFSDVDAETAERIGGKAKNLVIMDLAGLPVPGGYCIPYDSYFDYCANGAPSEGLIQNIIDAKARLGGKVAIRSSADCEDGSDLSMAGVFETIYVSEDADVEKAITDIYNQVGSKTVKDFMSLHGRTTDNLRMGLVVQRLIEPQIAGVAYTNVNGDSLLVQYTDGFGSSIVDGDSQGSAVLIDSEGAVTSSSRFLQLPMPGDLPQQLSALASKVTSLFGDRQDIEFAYDGNELFALQARPMTTPLEKVELSDTPEDTLALTKQHIRDLSEAEQEAFGTATSIFSDANYSELLPRPCEMDIGIHMYVWGGDNDIPGAKQLGHKKMGYLVPEEATGMIHYIGGRTYFSLARNAALYHIGFPETKAEYFSSLVAEYLQTATADPSKAAYPQIGLFLQDPTLKDLQDRYGDRAAEYFEVYMGFTGRLRSYAETYLDEFYNDRRGKSDKFVETVLSIDITTLNAEELADYSLAILEHIRTESYVDFVLGARLGFYYTARLQSLLEKFFPSQDADELFAKLSQGSEGSAITDANISIAEAPSLDEASQLARTLIGHYSTGEMLEIRHPRLVNDPVALMEYVRGIRSMGYKEMFNRQREERIRTEQLLLNQLDGEERRQLAEAIEYSTVYMALRETTKYQFTKEHLPLRNALELLGSHLGLGPGDIYFVYPRELQTLASSKHVMLPLIKSRKQAFENYQLLDMPSFITDKTVDELKLGSDDDEQFTKAEGKFLSGGDRQVGVVVNVDSFDDIAEVNAVIEDYKQLGHNIILVATQMNLSHDPLIAQASGLIIENAGIAAHGAQRARELGKGALGGIRAKLLTTGMKVLFDPTNRSVESV